VGGVADLGEWNPEPPTGGEAHTDLLGAVKNALHFFQLQGKGLYFTFIRSFGYNFIY
jgi:hypothetical protein